MRNRIVGLVLFFIPAIFLQILVSDITLASPADKKKAEFESFFTFQSRIRDYQEALRTWSEKIEKRPNDPVAHYNRGIVYSALGMHDLALADFNKAISLRPGVLQPYIGKLAALNALGKHQDSLTVANQVISSFNEHHWGYYWRGKAYLAKGQPQKAIDDFLKFLEKEDNPDRIADVCYQIGSAYFEMGEFNAAINQLNMAIVKNPLNFESWVLRGLVYKSKLEYRLALSDLRRGLQISKNTSLMACNSIAWILATCPDPAYRNGQEAVKVAKMAVDIDNSKPYYHDTLAAAYAEAGMFKEAMEEQKKALKLLGSVPESQRAEISRRYQWRMENYMNQKPHRDVEE